MSELAQGRAEEFFDYYGGALSRGDLDAIARCYSYPSLVVTATTSRVINTPEEVMAAFAGSDGPRELHGITRAVASVQSIESPPGNVAWVTVRWSYRDELDEERFADAYSYLLREIESTIGICAMTPVPVDWAHRA